MVKNKLYCVYIKNYPYADNFDFVCFDYKQINFDQARAKFIGYMKQDLRYFHSGRSHI